MFTCQSASLHSAFVLTACRHEDYENARLFFELFHFKMKYKMFHNGLAFSEPSAISMFMLSKKKKKTIRRPVVLTGFSFMIFFVYENDNRPVVFIVFWWECSATIHVTSFWNTAAVNLSPPSIMILKRFSTYFSSFLKPKILRWIRPTSWTN